MANIKSQIKRNRQNDKRRLRNRTYRGVSRNAVRNARTAIDSGVPESKTALQEALSALDKAAGKGIIHKNNAARRKSRLMKAFAHMVPAKAVVEPAAQPAVEAKTAKGKKTAPRKPAVKAEAAVESKKTPGKTEKAPVKKTAAKKTAAKKPAAKK